MPPSNFNPAWPRTSSSRFRSVGQPFPCRRDPVCIAQCRGRDLASRSRNRPVSEHLPPDARIRLRGDDKSNAQAGKAKKLAERAQHNRACRQFRQRQQRDFRSHIGKGFIDDQPPPVRRHGPRESRKVGAGDDAAVRIVRIDHDQRFQIWSARIRQCGKLMHVGTGSTPCGGMRTVGRRQNTNPAMRRSFVATAGSRSRCREPAASWRWREGHRQPQRPRPFPRSHGQTAGADSARAKWPAPAMGSD